MLDQERLHLRAAFFQTVRLFFQEQGFLEVDTPIRQPLLIPEQNITPVPSVDHFLQSSPELYMKRLLAGGSDKIFQLCHCFRYGERGRLHLEEFVMLEWYRQDCDYSHLMRDCKELICFLESRLSPWHFPVSLRGPWQKMTVHEAFLKYCSMTPEQALEQDRFDLLLVEKVEPELGVDIPAFLCDYPLELASLARPKPEDPDVAERFELYVAGVELANGFSELTDPLVQRSRFEEEYAQMDTEPERGKKMPELFLKDLEKIESAAGIAMGLDRLFMLICGGNSLSEVVTFSPDDLDM